MGIILFGGNYKFCEEVRCMTYYFVFIFSSSAGAGYGYDILTIDEKITPKTLAEVQDYLFNKYGDKWTCKPVIIDWKKLEEE